MPWSLQMLNKKIPVTIISGFLGAGKTTLVNRLISELKSNSVGVIVNEFGEAGIDGDLIVANEEVVIEINNGCICCTVRTDLVAGVKEMLARTIETPLQRIIVETSGMADPAPVLQTFLADPELKAALDVESVVTVVDAYHFLEQMKDELVREQIAFADVVILNKFTSVGPGVIDECWHQINTINPTAFMLRSAHADIAADQLLGIQRFSLPALLEIEPGLLEDEHDHEHDDSITSFSVIEPRPLNAKQFDRWINQLVINSGKELMRMKGILNLQGESRQFTFHSVHMLLDGKPGSAWKKDQPRESKIVFIGRNLKPSELEAGVRSCVYKPEEVLVNG